MQEDFESVSRLETERDPVVPIVTEARCVPFDPLAEFAITNDKCASDPAYFFDSWMIKIGEEVIDSRLLGGHD